MKSIKIYLITLFLITTSFLLKSQSITITQPNGGETFYTCEEYLVTWTQTGAVSNFFNIDYSLDSGVTWASVTTNFLSTNGEFLWTVPEFVSSTVKIRIRDTNTPSISDVSDNVFSIIPSINILTPMGGESYIPGDTHQITWLTEETSSYFNIEYSLNNGTTWIAIQTNYYDQSGVYNWVIPNTPSTECLIRVTDYQESCKVDITSSTLIIQDLAPYMSSFNTPTTLKPYCSTYVYWDDETFYSNVRLEYSTDNGTTWFLIDSNENNDGSFNWTNIPNSPTTQGLVKVTSIQDETRFDICDANITITDPIQLLSPNGGEIGRGCETMDITWEKSNNCLGTVRLEYSINNGASWNYLTAVSSNSSSTQTYTWNIPNSIDSDDVLIQVYAISYPSVVDESDAVFSVNTSNDITVTYPLGGETYEAGDTILITWDNTPQASGYYNVKERNTSNSFNNIITNITANAYEWIVPNTPTDSYEFQVLDYNNLCKNDIIDAPFSISQKTPTLLTPDASTIYKPLCDYYITWDPETFYDNVRIEYSLNNGLTWTILDISDANDGSYLWSDVPTTVTNEALVKIMEVGDITRYDVSDPFSIIEPITVNSPNGGELASGCNDMTISWTKSNNCLGSFRLDYSLDGGITWTYITQQSTTYSATQSYDWTVPQGLLSSDVLIKVAAASYPEIYDISDASFDAVPSNDVTVTYPTVLDTFDTEEDVTITWTNLPSASGQYTVQYSSGGGWSNIATNITGNAYTWTTPNIPTETYTIRVYDYLNTCIFDDSELFTVLPKTPQLLTPNGAEIFYPLCDYSITWDPNTYYSNYVRIEYSLNNGSSWVLLNASVSNGGAYTWTNVPNIPSTECLVRVMNKDDLSIYDVSDASFNIPEPITLITPNGGELGTGCGDMTISWEKSKNCIGDFILYYSIDNGANWIYITDVYDYSSVTQSYNWDIPNEIDEANVLVKVVSEDYPEMEDQSDATFSLQSSDDIAVTYPNGGEVFDVGDEVNITWTNLPSVSGQYSVQYKYSSSWITIASNITGNSYVWTPSNTPSENYQIRVLDYLNTCKFDDSNATFTLNKNTPLLLTPNGGETLYPYCDYYSITWDPETYYGNVRLEYSIDNGATWELIDASDSNDGTYIWYTTPNFPTEQCLVKVVEQYDLTRYDISDTTLVIVDPITIISPNGGEIGTGCNSLNISWDKSKNCIGDFLIYYSIDEGLNWTYITEVNDNSSINQSYNWAIPNGINSDDALIKIESQDYPTLSDESDAVFSLQSSNDIAVTYPNGGQAFDEGEEVIITWTNLPSTSGQYSIEYSTNGISYSTIASNVTGNNFSWTVPNTPSDSYTIRVRDYLNSCRDDISDAAFTVNPNTPNMLSPSGGEIFNPQCSATITWDNSSFYGTIRLEYSINNGTTWILLDASESNDGTFTWYNVPNTPSDQCLVKVMQANDLTRFDISDAVFTIKEPIEVLTPNGGEMLSGCEDLLITWESSYNCLGYFNIYYTLDNGLNWTLIDYIAPENTLLQSYNWTLPNEVTSSEFLIKVESSNDPSMYDQSDAVLSLDLNDDIAVTYPNGGEVFTPGENILISWTDVPMVTERYTVRYSINDGASWSTIASNITGNNQNWTVPNSPGETYRIQVYDYLNSCRVDMSDSAFSVSPNTPTLFSPNGGESYSPLCAVPIAWDNTSFYDYVRIEYTIDNGVTWSLITNGTSNDGNHNWYPPNLPSDNYLLKVSETNDLTRVDYSDATFSITEPITVLTPNGGEQTEGCNNLLISWEKSDCIGDFLLYYSQDEGNNWEYITEVLDTVGLPIQRYDWLIPNDINSVNMLVKVVAENDPTGKQDQSDANFSHSPSNHINVTYPNGGEVFSAGDIINIEWTNSMDATGEYSIEYSSGDDWTNSIVTHIVGNAHTWTIPNTPSTNLKVRIWDYNNGCREDASDMNFTIIPNTPLVTGPVGGEIAYSGTTLPITWDPNTYYTNVRLDYSIDGGFSWNIIDLDENNDGNYNWTIPDHYSTDCLVRVSHKEDVEHSDIGDALFTIKPAVTILTPNGDTGNSSILGGCTVTSITIDHSSAWNRYVIQYSLDNGANWTVITNNWTTTANPASYNWDIPEVSSDECLVRVYPYYASSLDDVSDNTFSIEKPVSLIKPNYGGYLQVGSNYEISWAAEGSSNIYDLAYSTNNGASWIDIETGYNTSTNTYDWIVPNNVSFNCLIRVKDNVDDCKADVSDNSFAIIDYPAPITLQTPNGGEIIPSCSEYNITWAETVTIDAYNIDYSTDLGASWISIVNNYSTSTASYLWDVPVLGSESVLIRIKEYTGSHIDLSDNLFTIDYEALSISPEETTIDKGESIQLEATGAWSTYVWTPADGLDDANIANPMATPEVTTTYVLTSTNGVCTAEDSITVLVNNNVYVDHTAVGSNNGSSWENAFTDLQDALALGDNWIIHIATGTYLPSTTGIRGHTFELASDVTILGGYPNGGGERDSDSYETILSGNVDNVPSSAGNSFHVMSIKDVSNVVIDGISIRDGNADNANSFGRSRGGGVYMSGASATFINVEIKWNRAIFGGGLFATLSPTVTFESCVFKKNTAGNGSALYHSNETSVYLQSTRIIENNSTVRSAVEVNNSLYTRIENSIIADNASTNSNALSFIATNRDQSCDIYNSTIIGETKNKYLLSIQVGKGDEFGINIYNSIIAHQNLAFDKAVVVYNNNVLNFNTENCYIQGSSVIGNSVDNIFSDVVGDLMLDENFALDQCSPAVNAGNDSNAAALMTDIDGNPRTVGTVDMGAYESLTVCPSSRESSADSDLGIKDLDISESIIVYPNPVGDVLFVKTDLQEIEIFVYDILGKRLAHTTSKQVNMSEFPTGLYHLNIFSNGKLIKTEKVIKN